MFSRSYSLSKAFYLLNVIFRATEIRQVASFDIFVKLLFRNVDASTISARVAGQTSAGEYI